MERLAQQLFLMFWNIERKPFFLTAPSMATMQAMVFDIRRNVVPPVQLSKHTYRDAFLSTSWTTLLFILYQC